MRITELDYHLPPDLVATRPAHPRDHSRLMVIQGTTPIQHRHFYDLPAYLRPGDLLVVNNTRVLPAKLELRRHSGAAIQGLFVRELDPGLWEVMLRTRGKVKDHEELLVGPADLPTYRFTLESRLGEGLWHVRVSPPHPAPAILDAIGYVPLPPYILKQRKLADQAHNTEAATPELPQDRTWYQTVFAHAQLAHSVAAPTAGLHFTPELLATLETQGISRVPVELQVGLGTFLPVETETLEEHPMHTEHYSIPAATIAALRLARQQNRRIVVVGTTAVRTIEAAAEKILDLSTPPTDLHATTNLKIAPGFTFRLTDALITNFHLPKSTLMALVAAFIEQTNRLAPVLGPGSQQSGVLLLKNLYQQAIQHHYRFYSYGDAMLLLPNA